MARIVLTKQSLPAASADATDPIARTSGTRRIARPTPLPFDAPELDAMETSKRPTVPVPRFKVWDDVSASSANDDGRKRDGALQDESRAARDEVTTVPAPPHVTDYRHGFGESSAFAALGSPDAIPTRSRATIDTPPRRFDHRHAFVLGLVDGRTDIEGIVDATPMTSHDTLAVLVELHADGLIRLD
jgi:hypothetical protein